MASPDPPKYFTPAQPAEIEIRIKGSLFIAYVVPMGNRAAAEKIVAVRRTQYPDATHHCFAWRLGFDEALLALSNDAGEPAGTAGKPILQALESRRLTNAICVVTRYFGGTKLGTGGLIRGYSAAAFAAIDQAPLIEAFPVAALRLQYDYAFTGAVEKVLHQIGGRVLSQNFSDNILCTIEVHRDKVEQAREMLGDGCSGRIMIESL